MTTEATKPARPTPNLGQIAAVFARYANTTFGGGSATITVLKEQVVKKRGWIDEGEFELNYALSRLTPGTNLLAFCTAAGWTSRRWLGAIVSLLASSLPCSLLVVFLTIFYEHLQGSRWFEAALGGALAAAVAIMGSTAWVFAEPHVKAAPWKAVVVVPAVVGLSLGLSFTPVQVLLLAAVTGLAWPAKTSKSAAEAKPEQPEAQP